MKIKLIDFGLKADHYPFRPHENDAGMAMSHLLRSKEHGSKASFGLSMGGIINIILDPIFMFGIFPEGQEVAGAAVATMLSNVIDLIYYCIVYYQIRTNSVLSVSVKYISFVDPLRFSFPV